MDLDDIIKSINSHTSNKFPGNDGITAKFFSHFSNELAPDLLDVLISGESLAPWVLLLEQESDVLYIKKLMKRKLKSTDLFDF